MRLAAFASSLLAIVACGLPQAASPDPANVPITYAARSEFTSRAGTSIVSEALTLLQSATQSLVTVADLQGAVLSLPTQLLPDGEIVANSADPAVTCYNTAKSLLAANDSTGSAYGPVFVHFGSEIVRIAVPLRALKRTKGADDAKDYTGTGSATFAASDGTEQTQVHMASNAFIRAAGSDLREAVIVTATSIGEPGTVVSRLMCSLTRSTPRTRALTAAAKSAVAS